MPTLENILYNTVDGVFAVDARQRIIFWDPGCEELFNRSSQWVLGRPCYDVICGKDRVNGAALCKANCPIARLALGEETPHSFAIQTMDGEGKSLNLSVNIVLLPSTCNNKWIVTHLLHRFSNQDVLTALESVLHCNKSARADSLAISIGRNPQAEERLSRREGEVLQLMAEGLNSAMIARRLAISHVTIRNHIQHIQHKLGVHSQAEAVAYAYRHNLVH